jgi:hypothetical protein
MKSHLVLALGEAGKKVLLALGQIPGRQQTYTEKSFPMASFLIATGHDRPDEELEMSFGRASFLDTEAKVCEAVAQDPAPFPQFASWLAPAQILRKATANPRWNEAGIPHRHLGRLAFGIKKMDYETRVRGLIPSLRERQRQMEAHLLAGLGGGFDSGVLWDALRMVEGAAPGQFSRITLHLLVSRPEPTLGENKDQWPAAAYATLRELEKISSSLPPFLLLAYGTAGATGLQSAAADCAQWLERALTNARDFASWAGQITAWQDQRISIARVWVGHAGRKEADFRRMENQRLIQAAAQCLSQDDRGVPNLPEPEFPALPDSTSLLFPDLEALGKHPAPGVEWRRQSLGSSRLIQRCFVPEAWPVVQKKFLEEHYEDGFRGLGVGRWFEKVVRHTHDLGRILEVPYSELVQRQLRAGRSLGEMAEKLHGRAAWLREKASALGLANKTPAALGSKPSTATNDLLEFALGLREQVAEREALRLAEVYHQKTREAGRSVLAAVLQQLAGALERMADTLEGRAQSLTAVAIQAGRAAELITLKGGLAGKSGDPPSALTLHHLTPEMAQSFWESHGAPEMISRTTVLESLSRDEFLDVVRAYARRQSGVRERAYSAETMNAAELQKLLQEVPPGRIFAELADDPAGESLLQRPPTHLQATLGSPPPGYVSGTLLAVENIPSVLALDRENHLRNAYDKVCQDLVRRILLHTEPEM